MHSAKIYNINKWRTFQDTQAQKCETLEIDEQFKNFKKAAFKGKLKNSLLEIYKAQ